MASFLGEYGREADGGGTPGVVFSVFCVWLQYGGTGLGAVGYCGLVFG